MDDGSEGTGMCMLCKCFAFRINKSTYKLLLKIFQSGHVHSAD